MTPLIFIFKLECYEAVFFLAVETMDIVADWHNINGVDYLVRRAIVVFQKQ